ncbi:MAG: 23S rRNA (uracil(1939)-C(5))-methyltransferase RlmD [Clostridiales bacterium]|nr:23S rRNA (uracil(1939)-C(5))-methyltransferase RlmD [Clostridiales bacterium]
MYYSGKKIDDLCPTAGKCGGCQLQNMDYDRQLKFKQAKVVKLLGKYVHVSPIIGMDNPYHYRNKVSAAFGTTRSGMIISGVYQSNTHTIVKTDRCMIEDEISDEIILSIRYLIRSFKLTVYNEHTQKGFLRHVLVRRGFKTGEIMVVLVTSTPLFPSKNRFLEELLKAHPNITTVVQNINNKFTSMVLGDSEKILYGSGYIEDELCGCKFRISSKSFYQINPVQTEKLYNLAVDFAELNGSETVIDAYCGVGTIGITVSKHAAAVVGTELNSDAVRDAKTNAKINKIDNIRFYAEDAGEFMEKLAENGEKADVVFTDPPRAGCSGKFLKALVKLSPKKIVYISCDPETQARDIRFLTENGYKVKKCQPVDMFPHTKHVETVVLLTK